MSQTFDNNEVIDGLIDVSDSMKGIPYSKPEIMETAPESESMLDCVFNNETPADELERVTKEIQRPQATIQAYGTTLTVEMSDILNEPVGYGGIELTCKNNASICSCEAVSIGIRRRWEKDEEDGEIRVVDTYSLTLYRRNYRLIEYHVSSDENSLSMALEQLFQMRDIYIKGLPALDTLDEKARKRMKKFRYFDC